MDFVLLLLIYFCLQSHQYQRDENRTQKEKRKIDKEKREMMGISLIYLFVTYVEIKIDSDESILSDMIF